MIIDLPQREAATDISKHVLLNAPAGSGKTEELTIRYLKLLAVVDHPKQIVCLTYYQ
jgi:superfamily I DNA/RNA helicase